MAVLGPGGGGGGVSEHRDGKDEVRFGCGFGGPSWTAGVGVPLGPGAKLQLMSHGVICQREGAAKVRRQQDTITSRNLARLNVNAH